MKPPKCRLKKQGFPPGSCLVEAGGKRRLACRATLKRDSGGPRRLITSVHLSRPENYLSITQSGCNFSCRKCHSWYLRHGAGFFPTYRMKEFRSPTTSEMIDAYRRVKSSGLKNIRLGNLGVFVRSDKDRDELAAKQEPGAI